MKDQTVVKIVIIILVVIFMPFLFSCSHNQNSFNCLVVDVHDGDTFTCSDKTKIRLWGVDTPEVPPKVTKDIALQNGGYISRDYLKIKIMKKQLQCVKKGTSYKRIVAQCFLNNRDIVISLLENELALEKIKYSKGYYSVNR